MKKIASLLVCLLVLFSGVVSACAEEIVYPMEEGITLSYAAPESAHVLALSTDWADTPFVKAWQEQTGITLEVSYYTDFSLLVASGDYPDILVGAWNTAYSGGIDRAIEDGIIVPINDYIEEYAPDYLAALESNPDYMKNARTAQGYIPGFWQLRSDPALNSYGAIVRKDWLDTLGMEVPTTLDEFYNMLVAFRDEMGATAPLSVDIGTLRNLCVYGIFTSPFNLVSSGYYHVDGTVHYGAAEAEFKDVLAWLNQLFNEGLLDANILTLDSATLASNIMNGVSGVAAGYASGSMGNWLTTMKDVDPEFALAGMGSLVRNEGDRAMFGQRQDRVATLTAITTACEDVEAAVKFLNYGYTEAGNLLMYYGIEGISYEIIDGYPYFTDFVKNNPDGIPFAQILSQYDYSPHNGPYLANGDYSLQTYNEAQLAALAAWQDNDVNEHYVPGTITVAPEDTDEYAFIKSEVDTYVNENFALFVTGARSLEEFDDYLATLESMGISRMLEIYQAAFDTFNA